LRRVSRFSVLLGKALWERLIALRLRRKAFSFQAMDAVAEAFLD
jgi:hypothetical protein